RYSPCSPPKTGLEMLLECGVKPDGSQRVTSRFLSADKFGKIFGSLLRKKRKQILILNLEIELKWPSPTVASRKPTRDAVRRIPRLAVWIAPRSKPDLPVFIFAGGRRSRTLPR